jgi:hypothetical protein
MVHRTAFVSLVFASLAVVCGMPTLGFAATQGSPGGAGGLPAPAKFDILNCIPDDAFIAARLRPDKLARTELWKMLSGPDAMDFASAKADLPLTIDLEKDITDVVLAFTGKFEKPGDEPKNLGVGLVLVLGRDVAAKDLFKVPPPETKLAWVDRPVFNLGKEAFLVWINSRTLVFGNERYAAAMAAAAAGAPRTKPLDPFWRKALDQPGELIVAGRMPEEVRAMLAKMQQDIHAAVRQNPPQIEAPKAFGLDLAMRMGLDVQTAVLVLDTARPEPVQLQIAFASEDMAAFLGSGANVLGPSLSLLLEAGAGELKPGAPPMPALYKATYQGKEARIAAGQEGLKALTAMLLPAVIGARTQASRTASAYNLMQIGHACHAYHTIHMEWPQNLDVLLKEGQIENAKVLQNPGLKKHFTDSDYVLVPLPGRAYVSGVMGYERFPEGQPPKEGINVLFRDGSVVFMAPQDFQQVLEKTKQYIESNRQPPK